MLRQLRAKHPEARITALVPSGYPREHIADLADDVVSTMRGDRMASAFWSVVKQIRAGNYDLFVTMFDSPRLRVLSLWSGASQRYCFTPDGRYLPMGGATLHGAQRGQENAGGRSLFGILLATLWANVRGRLLYAYIRHVVYHRPVEKS